MVPLPFCLSQVSGFPGFNKQGQQTMPKRLQTAAPTDRNDSKDLLLLLAYAKKLQETQRNIDEVCSLMQHRVPLEGLISAQDNRTLQSAKSCLQRLHVRVEALANVLEQTLISQQLQFMHAMAHFFFPSCASVALARSSHLVVLIERISKCIHYIPLWGFESGAKITSK